MDNDNAISIEVGHWATISGARVLLIIDPEQRRVYTWSCIGSGWPEAVHDGRHVTLAKVDPATVPESLLAWLQGRGECLGRLARVLASEGRSAGVADVLEVLEGEIQRAYEQGEIATYQDPAAYLAADPQGVVSAAIIAGSLDHAAEAEVEAARLDGVHLDPEATRRAIAGYLWRELDGAAESESERARSLARVLGAVGCECGTATGEDCGGWAMKEEIAIVEWMPPQHRDAHVQAGNRGRYPYNGSLRLRCDPDHAEAIVAADPEWAHVVG